MVDVIIPVYGQYELLEKCLNSLPDAFEDIPYRVAIYDNGTPMPMADKQRFYGQFPVRVSYGKKNLGYPLACNLAAKKGTNKYIFFLNSDIVLYPGSGKRMADYLRTDSELGILGMKLLFPDDIPFEHQGGRPAGKVQHYGISFDIRARPYHIFGGWSADNPKVMEPIEPQAVTGAALMVRRSLWDRVGGYNPDYGGGTYEDCSLSFAVRELGSKVMIYPDCVATHYTNATALKYNIGFPVERNHEIFFNQWKNRLEWGDGRLL